MSEIQRLILRQNSYCSNALFCDEKVRALYTDYLERLRSRFRFLNGEMLKVYLQEDGYGCIKRKNEGFCRKTLDK